MIGNMDIDPLVWRLQTTGVQCLNISKHCIVWHCCSPSVQTELLSYLLVRPARGGGGGWGRLRVSQSASQSSRSSGNRGLVPGNTTLYHTKPHLSTLSDLVRSVLSGSTSLQGELTQRSPLSLSVSGQQLF